MRPARAAVGADGLEPRFAMKRQNDPNGRRTSSGGSRP